MPQPPSAGGGGAAGVGNSTGYKYKQSTACPSLTTPSIIVADEDNQLPQPLLRPGDSWAAAAMSSPVIATSNRFAVLPRTDIDNDNDSDGQSLQEVQSRRAKRRRQQSNILEQQQQQPSLDRSRQGVGELQQGRI